MQRMSLLIGLVSALAVTTSSAAKTGANLKAECERVFKVYPTLMLAVMLEGPMNCGEPGTDEIVDCDVNETPAEKLAHARRLEVRKHQEAAYEKADKACTGWIGNKRSNSLRAIAEAAILEARAAANWRPATK
jgi:hypothetical protein